MRPSELVIAILASALVILACAQPRPQTVIIGPPPPTAVAFEVHGTEGGPPGSAESGTETNPPTATPPTATPPTAGVTKNQSPELKLKLGHFTDRRHNIGLVIDRTGHEAKLRFDGMDQILKLDPMRSAGRVDYVKTINQTILQVWDSGRVSVFITGQPDSIDVVRDADADPL